MNTYRNKIKCIVTVFAVLISNVYSSDLHEDATAENLLKVNMENSSNVELKNPDGIDFGSIGIGLVGFIGSQVYSYSQASSFNNAFAYAETSWFARTALNVVATAVPVMIFKFFRERYYGNPNALRVALTAGALATCSVIGFKSMNLMAKAISPGSFKTDAEILALNKAYEAAEASRAAAEEALFVKRVQDICGRGN